MKRKYKKRSEKRLLKRSECVNRGEYNIKKEERRKISNLRFVHIDANTFKMDMDDSDLLELVKGYSKNT